MKKNIKYKNKYPQNVSYTYFKNNHFTNLSTFSLIDHAEMKYL